MDIILKILTVAIIGFVELLAAVPMGFALDLSPIWIGIASISGAIIGVIVVILLGERLRDWIMKIHAKKFDPNKRNSAGRIYRIWMRFGVIGLGFLAPLVTGIPLGVTLGIIFGAQTRGLMIWSILGAIFWGVGITMSIAMGITWIENILKR